ICQWAVGRNLSFGWRRLASEHHSLTRWSRCLRLYDVRTPVEKAERAFDRDERNRTLIGEYETVEADEPIAFRYLHAIDNISNPDDPASRERIRCQIVKVLGPASDGMPVGHDILGG